MKNTTLSRERVTMWGRARRLIAGATIAGLFLTGTAVLGVSSAASAAELLPGPAPIEQRNAATVTADPLPTVQIDSGIVWAQAINGNTVYAGGSFSNARPAGAAAGTNLMPRQNLLAYNLTTGVATSFAPQINGAVKSLALSPDGSVLYVGGSFTQVDGQTRFNLAAFSTATGQLTSFSAPIGGSYVNAIVVTDQAVYVGGLIGAAKGVARKNLAAVSPSGSLLGWAPETDLQVDTAVLDPNGSQLIIGGRFSTVNGASQRGLAALDLTTGAVLPWEAPATVRNGWGEGSDAGKAGIWALSADSDAVFGTGWVFANKTVGNLEGLFSAEAGSGAIRWIADCHGDHYGVFSDGTNVYSTGHEHDCQTAGGLPQGSPAPGNMRHATVYTAAAKGTLTRSPSVNNIYADWSGYPAPAAVNWYPDWTTGTASGQGQAGWTVTGNGDYVVVGGEFPYVNGQRSQGIARFARQPAGGPKEGPRLSGGDWTPTARSMSEGTIRVSIPSNWDRDDLNLTYELREQGVSEPIETLQGSSTFWNTPSITMKAGGLVGGSTHTYTVVARDGDGNQATSAPVTTTVSTNPASAYAEGVLDDAAALYWRLGGPEAVGGLDWAGTNNAGFTSGVGTTSDDAINSESNGASTFSFWGGVIAGNDTSAVGDSFAAEVWFKTDTNTGGKILGYGNRNSGTSSSYDRHVYMSNDGRLTFGVYPGSVKTVRSSASYNDDQWHHVVAQQSADGMELYVDGQLVASDPAVTTAQSYLGYWRLGGDSLNGWPNSPSSSSFSGSLDEFAVYGHALTPEQISAHYATATGLEAPTAAFDADGTELSWSFDAGVSSAPDGRTIESYSWDFGDGQNATGQSPTHEYAEPGDYTVTLTVTDSLGLVGVSSQTVTATPPHIAPEAVIGQDVTGLSVDFTAQDSVLSDGAVISSYDWDFGDGQSSTEADPTHAYAAAGTYTVTLSVTDDQGATSDPVIAEVTVAHADPSAEFTATTDALDVAVDASASAAFDGATLEYAWDFGDGESATGVTASHTYAEEGTYTVTLTVTDSFGASADASQSVVAATTPVIAFDDFDRTEASGWGDAVTGGSWSGVSGFSVADGAGVITLNASQTRTTVLSDASVDDLTARFSISPDKVAAGGGLHASYFVHRTSEGDYRVKVRTSSTGAVSLYLTKQMGSSETILAAKSLSGYTLEPGAVLQVRLDAVSVPGGTQLQAKIWPDGSDEPTDWLVTADDGQAELQGAGKTGFLLYLSGSASNAPLAVSIDDLSVVSAEAPEHQAPVASFESTTEDLQVSVDGSGSTASDGATLEYAWDFGDGQTATGVTATHSYAQAGTYPVTLTVTDSLGAVSDPETSDVEVSDPPVLVTAASDTFERTVASGWGTADVGGDWSTAAGFSVSDGAGRMSINPGQTRSTSLTSVDVQDVDARMTVSTDKVADGGGLHFDYMVRKTDTGNYRLKLRFGSTGAVVVSLAKVVNGTETILANRLLSGYTHTAGAQLNLRLQAVTSGSETTLSGKVWEAGSEEPADWFVQTTDGQAELQAPGQIGLRAYLSGSATNAPVIVSVDDVDAH